MAVKTNSIISEMEDKLRARQTELEPLVEEHSQISKLLNSLSQTPATPRRRGTTVTASRVGHGVRSTQLLDVIRRNPEGITITNASKEPEFEGVHKNYLYRLAATALEKGQVVKVGSAYKFVSADPMEKQPA
jgi:hypothetical protein